MAKKKIFINRNGDVVAICDGIIENIPALGTKTIKRLANVEFNNAQDVQKWEVIDLNGKVLASHHLRSEAIKIEVELMTQRLRENMKIPAASAN